MLSISTCFCLQVAATCTYVGPCRARPQVMPLIFKKRAKMPGYGYVIVKGVTLFKMRHFSSNHGCNQGTCWCVAVGVHTIESVD